MKNQKGWYFLLIIPGLYIFLAFFSENWIYTDEFLYQNLSTQIPDYFIDEILETKEQYWWAVYLIQVLVVLVKVLIATFCIFVGIVLSDIEFPFKDLFRSVILAEVIFIISQAIYLTNLYINSAGLTLDTAANYFPLSILSLIGTNNVIPWLHYPLQTLNLFELIYVLFISWLLSKQWKPDFVESLNIVVPSYGIGLLLWMALVVFITLQIS